MNQLRVYYFDKIPVDKTTHIEVANIDEAKLVIKTLTIRDLNDDRVTDNAMGLEISESDEWCEWYDEESGGDIHEVMEKE